MLMRVQKRHVLFHLLGISVLGGALFLESLVFFDIAAYGRFLAVEHNPLVLGVEVFFTLFACVYWLYQYVRFVKWVVKDAEA